MKTFSSKLFFMSKSNSEKYTQISSVGAAVHRQVMKRKYSTACMETIVPKGTNFYCKF